LYESDASSVTVGEECGLTVFENKVLRTIFGPQREDETGSWRYQHNEELHNLCHSQNIIEVIKLRMMR
jgi:hypothetical protein